jgi:hypothetical protein
MLNGIVALLLALAPHLAEVPPADRIYGRVLTAGGDRLEGYLRWDRNETHWVDFLDGRKAIPWANIREAEELDDELRRRGERERSISLLGLRISWDEDDGEPRTTAAAVRFGHLRSLHVLDDRTARLVLLSGEEVEWSGDGSTDVGRGFRGLVVEDAERGEVELRWRDLDRVDFMAAPAGAPSPGAARLHGTLRTRAGIELRGHVAWDMDETLTTDILDGEHEGRDLELDFGSIAVIEWEGRDASRVTLTSGEELVLTGSNDVDSDNRGIEISDPALGRAIVTWDDFESLVFHAPGETAAARETFDGGRPLVGTVETRTGERHTGRIRWDNDEEQSWEVLDGRSEGVDYDIELGLVRAVVRVGASAARVELLDGRSLLLDGSNDVSDENQGIIVRGDGQRAVLVRWRDVERVTFGS